jgi:hypothetical protein
VLRLSVLYPAGSAAKVLARREIAAAAVHPVEAHVMKTLAKAGGWTVERIGAARWRLNGVEVDRLLLAEIGVAVRTGKELPVRWFAKATPRKAAA